MEEKMLLPYSDIYMTKKLPFLRGLQTTFEKYRIFYNKNYCGGGSHAKIWMGIVVVLYTIGFIY